MKKKTVREEHVDNSKVHRVIFDDCHNFEAKTRYSEIIRASGGRVQDFIIDFKMKRVKFFVTLDTSLENFVNRLNSSIYGEKITEEWKKTKGVTEL